MLAIFGPRDFRDAAFVRSQLLVKFAHSTEAAIIIAMRREQDRRIDAVLLLYVLRAADGVRSSTRLQKLLFLIEWKLRLEGLTATHYRFFRYLDGPYSQHLKDDLDRLSRGGFITKTTLTLTERGRFLIDLVIPTLGEIVANRAIFDVVDSTLKWSRSRQGDKLARYLAALEVAPDEYPEQRMKLRDVPRFWTIVEPSGRELKTSPEIDRLLRDELAMTTSQYRAAKRRTGEIERRMLRNLATALKNGDQPSAQTLPG